MADLITAVETIRRSIENLPLSVSSPLYRILVLATTSQQRFKERFWSPFSGDKIESQRFATVLLLSSVQFGPRFAVRLFGRCIAFLGIDNKVMAVPTDASIEELNRGDEELAFHYALQLLRLVYIELCKRRSYRQNLQYWMELILTASRW